MNKFYSMRAIGNGVAEVRIYGVIGDDWYEESVTAASMWEELASLGDVSLINVYINSPGGSVFDGLTIVNQLRRHKARVHTYVEGLAASMASLISVTGDRRYIYDSAMIMIHNPTSGAYGEAADLRKQAEALEKIEQTGAAMYAQASGKDIDSILAMMAETTWLTAQDALELGFVDEIIFTVAAAAHINAARQFDLSKFNKLPQALQPAASHQPVRKENTVSKKALLTTLAAAVAAAATASHITMDALVDELAAAAGVDQSHARQALTSPADDASIDDAAISALDAALKARTPPHPAPAPAASRTPPVHKTPEEAYAAGMAAGRTAELERIRGVQSQVIPGHESLVSEMAFDGNTTPEQAAIRVLAAERAANAGALQARRDAGVAAPRPAVPPVEPAAPDMSGMPLDDRIKATWDATPSLREEFGGDFSSYAAYAKACQKGSVKVMSGSKTK